VRILITTDINYADGGTQTYLWAVSQALEEAGHEIKWLIGKLSTEDIYFPDLARDNYWAADRQSNEEIKNEIHAWQPDIVYSHGLNNSSWDEWFVTWTPVVFFLHGYHGACISGTKCHSFMGNIVPCQRTFSPACLFVYLPWGCGGTSAFTMLSQYRHQSKYHGALRKFTKLLVASEHMFEIHRNEGIPENKLEKVRLFPTGLRPVEKLDPQTRWNDRVLLLSRLTEAKGAQLAVGAVLEASNQLGRKLTLRIVGEGPLKKRILNDALRLNVLVEFLGQVVPTRREEVMKDVDALIFPSVWPEPFGLAGIESACFGIPAVGFKVGGVSEWLADGQTGIMAQADSLNSQSLGSALAKCLSNHEQHNQLRANAWQLAKEFSVEIHLDRLVNIFKHAITEYNNPTSRS
jgi:glycosyltransferase involved in cell wall biosynthesis